MADEHSDERRLSLQERLALVYERLDQLPPVHKPEEAFKQLATTLDQVEDEFSGVPRNPNPGLNSDGRMYPPREDFTEHTSDGGLQATTRGNIINIAPNGTMSILSRKSGEEVYRKPGAELGEPNTLDAGLRKVQSLAANDYQTGPKPPRQPRPTRSPTPPQSIGSRSATTAHRVGEAANLLCRFGCGRSMLGRQHSAGRGAAQHTFPGVSTIESPGGATGLRPGEPA